MSKCRCLVADFGKIASTVSMTFSYSISLQVRHPDADPNDIATTIGLPVKRSWKAGEPRSTPRGNALPGHYGETYCAFDVATGDDGEMAERIRGAVAALMPRRGLIEELRATGGSLNFYVTWTVGERGEVFNFALLADLGRLGIDLGVEAFRSE
jgi:hypothetical protein